MLDQKARDSLTYSQGLFEQKSFFARSNSLTIYMRLLQESTLSLQTTKAELQLSIGFI
jgi:hypothetical protein